MTSQGGMAKYLRTGIRCPLVATIAHFASIFLHQRDVAAICYICKRSVVRRRSDYAVAVATWRYVEDRSDRPGLMHDRLHD